MPFSRIVAYYGNLYSTKMGVLGEYPEAEMLQKLEGEVKKWEMADPTTPVIPALHYISRILDQTDSASFVKLKNELSNKIISSFKNLNR